MASVSVFEAMMMQELAMSENGSNSTVRGLDLCSEY